MSLNLSPISHSRPTVNPEAHQALSEVLETRYLAQGPKNKELEKVLCQRYKRRFALLTSSGVGALHLSLLALGVGAGWQVFVPSFVCTALLNAIYYTGATPVLTDTPHQDLFMDPSGAFLPQELTKVAVIYPQMFGVVQKLNFPPEVKLIEDCAMSLGEGALKQGQLSVSSFYATKMLATGQGGAILSDDENLYNELQDLTHYDNRDSYRIRYNYSLSDLGAALGLSQFKILDANLERRKTLALRYDEAFKKFRPELLAQPQGLCAAFSQAAFFRYWIKTDNGESCMKQLAQLNIEVKRPVFKPLHQYLNLLDQDFPFAQKAFSETLSLALYPELKESDQDRVIEAVIKWA